MIAVRRQKRLRLIFEQFVTQLKRRERKEGNEVVEILDEAFNLTKAEAAVADDALAASSLDPDPNPDKEVSAFQGTKLSIIPTDNTFNSKQ